MLFFAKTESFSVLFDKLVLLGRGIFPTFSACISIQLRVIILIKNIIILIGNTRPFLYAKAGKF
jgi:hypothetical protein